ncbi:MAG: nuclear transport factor 2 family protein [Acidimicrobiia bacterium]|nr:nuclear transport factor 2 family protein [Acidimicrobiia bacterium]MBT8193838.1 nuclear transport factor 2 family protein [Acidimicrobiia bacterium]NNF88646.1 hypothetical protein [Acidimicrobiia bacterium]NNL12934.1 hypothetical protein [Acidimicrobiia bacterium]NNL69843.1 hypothetical protein [Acidimicrobiia bacterium]
MPHSNDAALIAAVAADYIEGWYTGDVTRMDRALHPDLLKRTMVVDEETGVESLRVVTKERMVEMTESGGGEQATPEFEAIVDDISGDIGAAHTISPDYIDYLQLVRTTDGWKIANVLFRIR